MVVLAILAFSGPIGKKIDNVEAYYVKTFHKAVNDKLYESFKKTADTFNKRGPTMVSKNIRLDKTVAGPGAKITYYYSFVNKASSEFNPVEFNTALKANLIKVLCKNSKVKPTLELGATYAYVYSGNDNIQISKFDINNNDCKNI